MSSTWVPKPRNTATATATAAAAAAAAAATAAAGGMQWPKAVGSRPAPKQPRSPTAVETEPLGAYTYISQGNPGIHPRQPSRPVLASPPPVQPQHRANTPTVYQPVTPPSSPPRLLQPAAPPRPPVPSNKRGATPPAGNLRCSRVSPSSSSRCTSPRCICHRGHSKIMCYVCGKTQVGRVRMQCPEHPNTIHLMDYDRCPDCKAVNLAEMRPH